MTSIKTSVLIIGGGPVGMTMAALLAKRGVDVLVVEADEGYCLGSRATCVSRRSLEIMGWAGADAAMMDKSLPWSDGRSFYKDREVLHFQMPADPTQRFAPMVNIQQYYVEEFSHKAFLKTLEDARQAISDKASTSADSAVLWNTRLTTLTQSEGGVTAQVVAADGKKTTIHADWMVASDGGKSTVREQLGLKLEGMQYDGRYVIVDIKQKTKRPTERLAWFDPPSNPGSTILMHRQPDDVWRIDYQLRDGEDPDEAIKPENVLPRVQSHLSMIGEDEPWEFIWIAIYNAKCLTLPSYRKGRIFFAGDAAHLVPIFGVRGLNSGFDDAGNLAWKLALVVQGKAEDKLLDSYSIERVHATYENLRYGAKSTEFMSPPHHGFSLMRQAALRLSTVDKAVSSLINPRQSLPIEYVGSPLNVTEHSGLPAPEAILDKASSSAPLNLTHLSQCFGDTFTLLQLVDLDGGAIKPHPLVRVLALKKLDAPQVYERYAGKGACVLIRPDGYIAAEWGTVREVNLDMALSQIGIKVGIKMGVINE
jgi:3-(3-hydroxy-phenyl)propionate hydroxylase